MITNFDLYLESIADVDNDKLNDRFINYCSDNFKNDDELIKKISISDDYGFHIKDVPIEYYNNEDHNMYEKINCRTLVNSISEFNEIIKKELGKKLYNNFNKISNRLNLYSSKNRIAIYLKELNAFLIISYDPFKLFEPDIDTYIIINSIIPILFSRKRINKIIGWNEWKNSYNNKNIYDDYFSKKIA